MASFINFTKKAGIQDHRCLCYLSNIVAYMTSDESMGQRTNWWLFFHFFTVVLSMLYVLFNTNCLTIFAEILMQPQLFSTWVNMTFLVEDWHLPCTNSGNSDAWYVFTFHLFLCVCIWWLVFFVFVFLSFESCLSTKKLL